jgi:hypothetical protein
MHVAEQVVGVVCGVAVAVVVLRIIIGKGEDRGYPLAQVLLSARKLRINRRRKRTVVISLLR